MEYDERTSDNTHLIALGCPMYERDLKVCQLHAAAVKAAQNALENPLFTENSGINDDTTLVPITTAYHLATPCEEVKMLPSSRSSSLPPSLSSSPSKSATPNQNLSIKPTESENFMSKVSLNKLAIATWVEVTMGYLWQLDLFFVDDNLVQWGLLLFFCLFVFLLCPVSQILCLSQGTYGPWA